MLKSVHGVELSVVSLKDLEEPLDCINKLPIIGDDRKSWFLTPIYSY